MITLLRRIAQMVQDLRTLKVLNEKDYVQFTQSENRIELKICLDTAVHKQMNTDVISIEQAIKTEFISENGVGYDEMEVLATRSSLIIKC